MTIFATLCWYVLTLSFSNAVNSNLNIPEDSTLKKYYSLLEYTSSLPGNRQIIELKKSLNQFSKLEHVYLKLVDICLLENKLDSLSVYFQKLAGEEKFRRNSHWALAKIYILKTDAEKTFASFTEALKTGPISTRLLIDFVAFSHSREDAFDWKANIRQLPLDDGFKVLVAAIESHFKPEHSRASGLFSTLPKNLLNDSQILHLWGTCFYDQSLYAKADSLWQLGLKRAREIGDLQAEALFLSSLGLTASQIFLNSDSAAKYYGQAEQIAMRIGDRYRLQMVLGNRAMGKETSIETIADYREAIRMAEQMRCYDDAANWYMGLAQVYFLTEGFTEALDANNAAEKLARSLADKTVLLQIIRDKGDFLFDLHQDSLARVVYQEMYYLAKAEKRVQQEKSVNARLADYLLHEKKYADARTAYFDFIDFLPDDAEHDSRAYWRGKVAESFRLEGRYDLARLEYNRAIEIAKAGDAKLYENWLSLEAAKLDLLEDKFREAMAKCKTIIDFAVDWQDDQLRWQALYVLGRAHKGRGDFQKAISALKKATNLIEKTRHKLTVDQLQISYFSEAHEAYRQLVSCCLKKYEKTNAPADLDTLFYFTQLTRGRTLHVLGLRKPAMQKSMQQDEEYKQHVTRLRRIQRRLRYNPDERIDRQSELETARLALLTKRLRLSGGEIHSESTAPMAGAQWLSPIMKHLKKQNTGLLLYHVARDTSFVFVVAGDSAQIVGINTEPDALRAMVNHLMAPFHEVKSDSVQYVKFRADLAHKLYRTLILPVEQTLNDNMPENLLIVPDIALMNLPFDMLLVHEQKKTAYRPKDEPDYAQDFLLHRYTISYSPSLSFLRDETHFLSLPPKILVFSNPFTNFATQNANARQSVWQIAALPFAEDEASRIKALYGSRADIFKRDAATKPFFFDRAGDYRIIHFATHAFADNTFDAFSRLFLAATSDSTDDGILMGYEIADLQLQADLVALSACETGRGRVVSGEGVLGLPRLFLGAGAKSVLMTQWVIDDEFASQLLPDFYRFCLNNSFTKAAALTEAKRQVFRKTKPVGNTYLQHPFYWASYTLYGNPGKIQYTNGWVLAFYILIAAIIGSFAIFAGYSWLRRSQSV